MLKPPEVFLEAPVLKISFDSESADDESGYGSNGTVIGNPEYTEGVYGKAIHFQNPEDRSQTATQYVDFGQPDNLKFGEESFSIMFWYKAEEMIQTMKEKLSEVKNQLLGGECEDAEALLTELQSEYDTFLNGAEANMSFHMVSDAHVQNETGTAGQNFAKGLQDMQNVNPSASALVSAGDNTQNGTEEEVNAFFKILDENNPVSGGKTMIALGNHDVRGTSGYWEDFPVEENGYWRTAYNLYMTNNEKYMPETGGKTYFDYWVDGYHFIILNPENSAKDTAYLTEEQLSWLDEKLGENEDISRPGFVVIHQALNDTHWRSYMYNGFGPQDEKVKEILSHHPQTIVLSGHIHNGFGVTEAIDRPYGTVVDVPAFTGSSYGLKEAGTGYEVYIYDDEVLFRARNFVTSTWMPEYDISVKLKNLPVLVSETDYLSEENYTEESWALASPKIQEALAEAEILMNQKYEESTTLPNEWYYHKDGREKLEKLCEELKDDMAILVEKDVILPVKVSLNKTHLNMSEGESFQLTAKLLPENTTDTSLTWSSSDNDVISVDAEGNVTANTAGSAVITVSAVNGKTAQCTVNAEAVKAVINTKLPVRYIGELYELPDTINVTLKDQTFDTKVTWNQEEKEALLCTEETGKYTITGTLEEVENREVQAEIVVAPGNVVYFVDSGASSFTEKGQLLAEANSETMKNTVPDQAYDAESGWGFTNSADDLGVSGSGDAYTTIRYFKAKHNGLTLTYQFALESGTYDVTAGFYDPWAQWAGDWRHAKLSLTNQEGTELAVTADYHISGNKDTVQFENVVLTEDGSLSLNAAPLNSENDSCDVMISFILITRKDTSEADRKAGLAAAITIAEILDPECYTKESYAVLEEAIAEAKIAYATNGLSEAQIQAQIDNLAAAVKNLETAAEEENRQLSGQLAEKEQELAAKIQELANEKAESERLKGELQTAQDEVTSLTEQLAKETEKITSLTEQLDTARKELEQLKQEAGDKESAIAALNERIAGLELELEQTENEKTELETQLKEAKDKADRLETELAEVQIRVSALETEQAALTKETQELREALKKAVEEAEKAKAELEKLKNPTSLKKGDNIVVNGVRYRVTDALKKQAQAYGVENKSIRTISVASSVTINGVVCSVTTISDKAFAGCKKGQKAVIGKNINAICKKAFYGDKALRSIQVKSRKIKSVGKQSLKGISAKAVIKVPKSKKKAYSRYFAGKGQKKSVKIKS
ncbi:MAG: Ig-like domain-containing protein [Firmicutes bacterium]|nr:Ig-like domain-containing protein [Bacillota bacterium]